MLRVTLRGVRAHAVRFALSVLAVALGVAFVAGTFALRTMMSSTFHGIVDAQAPAEVYVRGTDPLPGGGGEESIGEARTPVPIALVDEVADVDGVDVALPDLAGPVVLVGADGTAVQSTQAPSIGIGFDERDPSLTVLQGRGPAAADEVALEVATLESSGLALGDRTDVVVAGEVVEVEVVGEVSAGGPMAGATLVFLDHDAALAAFAPEGLVSTVSVYGTDGTDEQVLADAVGAALDGSAVLADAGAAGSAEAVTGASVRADLQADIDQLLGFVTTFLLVFAVVSLFVGAFLIANTFAMSVRQRVREFALLRAVGASPAQVFTVVVGQAVVVGLVGSALGVLGGLGLVSVLRVVLAQVGMDLTGDVPLEVPTVVLCLVLGTVVSAVAAAVPARTAALVAPVEAMRGDVTVPERSLRLRAVLGGLVALAGAAAVGFAAVRPATDQAELLLGGGAAAVLVGVLVASPTVARAVLRVLTVPFVRLLPPMGRLAQGNVVRNPRRTAGTAGALVIGMALVGAVSVIAASAQQSLASVVESSTDADLVLRSATQIIPTGAVDDVAALPEVGASAPLAFGTAAVSAEPGADPTDDDTSYVVGLEPGVLGGALLVDVEDGSTDDLADGTAVINSQTAGDGWAVGDTVTVRAGEGTRDLDVVAVVDTQVVGASVVVTRDVLDALVTDPQVDTVFLDAAPGVGLDDLRTAVADAVAPYVVVSVQDQDEFVDAMAAQVDQLLVILYALLGLSLVIAVLGIVNTLALSVIERTREIGLLRAVGLGRLQLAGTVTIESVLTAVLGTVLGLAVGVGLASALPRVYAEDGLDQLVLPWDQIATMVGLAVVVGVLAALWPATRAARLRALDAIASE
ncbi:ABC transporter permease [Cellulomonas oligotrophica]|uniref:Putative ABC transport system permease protein n=1 Tax=Cellulomonas oligotrophica TaxID=931536 RepID=A0A7Y9FGG4_9CELL|nr:ABC transporter permease [Cellulomonas oligotrophica]NYD86891.1 putative ABC transport system permease protein [Cellulomonas oligotrophica]